MDRIINDEPSNIDELGRSPYAKALSKTILRCETPFTIGVYGDWGSGKTSLLQLVSKQVSASGAKCVWFNAWLHQRHDDPALALLHTIANDLRLGGEAKKLLAIVGATLSGAALKVTTNIGVDDIKRFAEAYEKEEFQLRDERTRLREKFEKFVKLAQGSRDGQRLVVFIDDLDRCSAPEALSVLEALKLYLNIAGCVYVLAADRAALEAAIDSKYGKSFVGNSKYLDKIVQLPFSLPPIHPTSLEEYVRSQLDGSLGDCTDLLVAGFGPNPRALKRFVNVLGLNNELAIGLGIADYNARWLCVVLLIQYLDPEKYLLLSADESALNAILSKASDEPNSRLRAVLEKIQEPPSSLLPYIHLANVSSVEDSERTPNAAFMKAMHPSAELAKIVGAHPLPRTEVTKLVWDYIKQHQLQDKDKRTLIHSDDLLRPIFKADSLTMFQMTKLINAHLKASPTDGSSDA